MPKSKRDKKISLTKTTKKGLVLKQQIIEDIRNCVSRYDRIFLLSVQNMRNNKLKELREAWKGSRFFFGKNKVISIALGRTSAEEAEEGLHKLSNALKGQCCLLFTNKKKKEVVKWLAEYEETEYARSGFVSTESVVLPKGPLLQFPHSMEPHLRQLGMPTALQKGIVTLISKYKVCKKEEPLTPEQAKILKLFGKAMATIRLIPLGVYSKQRGFKNITCDDMKENDDNEEMELDLEGA